MSLGDKSAYPVQGRTYDDVDGRSRPAREYGWMIDPQVGLTKREEFAKAAMQGILSSYPQWPDPNDAERAAQLSVIAADALLKQLTK